MPPNGRPSSANGPSQSGSVGDPWQPAEVPAAFVARSLSERSTPTSRTTASRAGSKPSSANSARFGWSHPDTLPRPSPWQRVLPTCTL